MFKHILIPTDGSPASESAIRSTLKFAKECGARVTGLYVIPDFHVVTYRANQLEETRASWEKESAALADKLLGFIADHARELGVPCEVISRHEDAPYEAILAAATDRDCDLIAMASHGYKGIKGLLLGSETHKVLVHGSIPVLVFRPE